MILQLFGSLLLATCLLGAPIIEDYDDSTEVEYLFGPSANGKPVHEMRTFVNVTFDWSAKRYDEKTDFEIPLCHEWRIRRSYLELNFPEYARYTVSLSGDAGRIVYPLVLTVSHDSASDLRSVHYAAAVHKGHTSVLDELDGKKSSEPPIAILIVHEDVWRKLWARWIRDATSTPADMKNPRMARREDKNSTEFCEGGIKFDDILPEIYADAKKMPAYETIVNQYYTDLITDACYSAECLCPREPRETVTFAYPTDEGLEQLRAAGHFKDDHERPETNLPSIQLAARGETDLQTAQFIRVCYDREFFAAKSIGFNKYKEDSSMESRIKANYEVFYGPSKETN